MVNWTAASQIARDADAFAKLVCAFFGLYVWELFTTCGFEWSLITGKRKFTWPLVLFYFLCRYCLFFALISLLLSLTIVIPIDCGALYTFSSWTGNMTILAASTSLMFRTIAIWERQLKVMVPLVILCLIHWAILWRGMFIVHASYDTTLQVCVVTSTNHVFLNISFFTTMGFDFVILCFTVAALTLRHKTRTDLWHLLFRDGLVYFFITFFCNALPAVFNVVNLNSIMNVIATIPAATISAIAACRLVVRLQDFHKNTSDAYLGSGSQVSTNSPRSPVRFTTMPSVRMSRPSSRRPEVCITTDHFVMDEISPTTASTHSPFTPLTPGMARRTSAFDFKVEQIQESSAQGEFGAENDIYRQGTQICKEDAMHEEV